MDMPNAARGEFSFRLGEQDLLLVPDHEAIMQFESGIGRSAIAVGMDIANERGLQLREAVAFVSAFAKRTRNPRARLWVPAISAALLEQGLPSLYGPIMKVFNRIHGIADDVAPTAEDDDPGNAARPASAG